MKNYFFNLTMLAILQGGIQVELNAQNSEKIKSRSPGFYMNSGIGANFAGKLEFDGASNDVASYNDQYINPDGNPIIPNKFVEDWSTEFDPGKGILSEIAVGYHQLWDGLRVEVEYFYRESKFDQTSTIGGSSGVTYEKLNNGELENAEERLGSITSQNVFGNLYYDFVIDNRFTVYIGVGAGMGFTEADWGSLWQRTLDKTKIDLPPSVPNPDEVKTNLSGATSVSQTTLIDELFGYQVLAGVDYEFTESMSLGIKVRYVSFNEFRDELEWNPLRSHPPYVKRDPQGNPDGPRISGEMSTTKGINMLGISLSLKYYF